MFLENPTFVLKLYGHTTTGVMVLRGFCEVKHQDVLMQQSRIKWENRLHVHQPQFPVHHSQFVRWNR